ncbi:potassium transporter Kup [Stagnihabitans tardus]|uniref:Probable potassium transport system protein Kup n=1 Tax=Stagnihabitans tardus TaxID=2699202 RepID=A0AAE4Y7A3_9RHOB|nr:potassium transporter Kup [Stagnihabitans tardus]NBZ86454.1 potassium transporter Kup [Stagnihabitans tardus]
MTPSTTHKPGLLALSLAAIGVVYGDIGTSPLYAFREAMHAAGASHGGVRVEDVLGVLSLITWSLMIIVTFKYVALLMRADNQGEGGTLSLLALAERSLGGRRPLVLAMGLFGAALFYGDAALTPAVSVLSAVEGLSLVTTAFDPYILPISMAIIVGLFLVQARGTEAVARFFGPITLVWFLVIGLGGTMQIVAEPRVLEALNPWAAVQFLAGNGKLGLIVLGAVFLAVTGAEALYADMGHFGRKPIQLAWIFVALPALLLNYYGQGALVLADPAAMENPFFRVFPETLLLPVVILATAATIIASQAVISGAFSLTRQAIQLRLLPRMRIRHTSDAQEGQIFMPAVNQMLLVAVLVLVVTFGSSSALASAYGIAVTGTMVVTATLAMIVAHKHWGLSKTLAVALFAPLLALDLVFFGANLLKLFEGGWLPLGLAMLVVIVMTSWIKGTGVVLGKEAQGEMSLEKLIRHLGAKPLPQVPGTAVFLTSDPDYAPAALLHSLKHFKVLHEQNVILTIRTADIPRVAAEDRVQMVDLAPGFRQVTLTWGYAEEPDVPEGLALCRKLGWKFDIMSTSFILSRRSLRLSSRREIPAWMARLFILMARNSAPASDYFRIPAGRVVELGTQVNV